MNNNQTRLRPSKTDDLELIHSISRRTFYESFSWYNTPENMGYYLEHNLSPEKLRQELSAADSRFYLLEQEGTLAGYFKINAGKDSDGNNDAYCLEIERIYVLKKFHGTGFGQLLLNEIVQIAKNEKRSLIWLGVWELNPRAIAFYTKNGFRETGQHPFMLGEDKQTDKIMELKLTV